MSASHQPWLCPGALRGPLCLRGRVSELGSLSTAGVAAGPVVPGLAGLQLAAALAAFGGLVGGVCLLVLTWGDGWGTVVPLWPSR